MMYDGKIYLAVGNMVNSRTWRNKKYLWSELVAKLSEENKTNETYKEFMSASKEEQLKIKDVGGYVGGFLRNGRRKPENVAHRQLLTLDIDNAVTNDLWDDFTFMFDNAAVLHGTHKHSEATPRYRLIIPLSEEVTPDEYVPIARYVAGILGIDLFDPTTFETNRLMFWPSNPRDTDYYFEFQDGDWMNPKEILGTYKDWKDSSQWPTSKIETELISKGIKKQENPLEKKGVVGSFCRSYSISEAIGAFLSDAYEHTDVDGRYTYKLGTTAGGLIVYEDLFAYSHHGTDPCSGKLSNAFDLIRLHKYGEQDSPGKTGREAKSYKLMEIFALADSKVKRTIAKESLDNAKYDFADEAMQIVEDSVEWMEELEADRGGKYLSTATNINIVLANDSYMRDNFRQNDFDGKRYIFRDVPWRAVKDPEPMKNVDYSGIRNYVESIYGIAGNLKIDDSLALQIEHNHYHPVREYLSKLKWDGVKRVDALLTEYFGAEDTIYTRESIRKALVGAAARIFDPGCKFDLVLTLVGKQGTGKSTFIKKLGKQWFSDTFMTVQGKEALEQIQGAWLIEMAELAGLKKAEIESVKHFISKQEDAFRPAYSRVSETYKRQCVFFGTTNNKDFLRDPSGNRRFLPIDIDTSKASKSVFDDLDDELDQIWAEAVYMYRRKETLFLSKDAEAMAYTEQRRHSETDERVGVIEDYLSKKLPDDWSSLDIYERREYLNGDQAAGVKLRRYVCIAEVWTECLGKEKEDMDRYKTRELNDIMRGMEGWEQSNSTKNFTPYGKQKYYLRAI